MTYLATLGLWPEPPEWDRALRFRQWAFESTALDLALRQAGHSRHTGHPQDATATAG